MATNVGLPNASDIKLLFDGIANPFNILRPPMGFGVQGESGTSAIAWQTNTRLKVEGDGTSSYPGLESDLLKRIIIPYIDNGAGVGRIDSFYCSYMRGMLTDIDSMIIANMPTGWSMVSSTGLRPIDMFIGRMNGSNPNVPATPAAAPTLAATTGGSIPPCSSGNAPVVVFTWVGTQDDWESQPSAAATTVALANGNSAYNMTIAGNAVTAKLRIYMTFVGDASGLKNYVKDVSGLTIGAAIPTISITESDAMLRPDVQPPSWMSCQVLPEESFLFAAGNMSPINARGGVFGLPTIASNGMMTINNIVIGRSDKFLGINNPSSSGLFGTKAIGSAYVEGVIQKTNDSSRFLQGYFGATEIQARVTTALDANAALSTITYNYYDATHPTTEQTTGSIAGPVTLVKDLGSVVSIGVTAGQIVTRIKAVTVGTATSGTFIFEGLAPRTP